jgi:uroporphyrinogen-III synthase
MKLLVIRPQPGADATALRAHAAGFEVAVVPLFGIEPVAWEMPQVGEYEALMLTSGNAVRQAGDGLDGLKDLPTYVVGTATARAAGQAGLTVVAIGNAGIDAILSKIQAAGHKRILWLAGEDRTDAFIPRGMTVDVRTVYSSALLPEPADFDDIVASCSTVMLHSPRAALHFLSLCQAHGTARTEIRIAALSAAIAESAGTGWQEVIIAPQPNDAALLSQLQSRFTTTPRDP